MADYPGGGGGAASPDAKKGKKGKGKKKDAEGKEDAKQQDPTPVAEEPAPQDDVPVGAPPPPEPGAGGFKPRERGFVEGKHGALTARDVDEMLAAYRAVEKPPPKVYPLEVPDEDVVRVLQSVPKDRLIQVLKREINTKIGLKRKIEAEEAAAEEGRTHLRTFMDHQRKRVESEGAAVELSNNDVPTEAELAALEQWLKEKAIAGQIRKAQTDQLKAELEGSMFAEVARLADVTASLIERGESMRIAWDKYLEHRNADLVEAEIIRGNRIAGFEDHIMGLVQRTNELHNLIESHQELFCKREQNVLAQEHKLRKYNRALGMPIETPRRPTVGVEYGSEADSNGLYQDRGGAAPQRQHADAPHPPQLLGGGRGAAVGGAIPDHSVASLASQEVHAPALAGDGQPSTYLGRTAPPKKKVAGVLGYLSSKLAKAFNPRRGGAAHDPRSPRAIARDIERMESRQRPQRSPSYHARGKKGQVSTFDADPEDGFQFPMV